jgi:hypothetical protein
MSIASIVFSQNDTNQSPGSRDDLVLGVPVILSNQNNTGVASWLWQFIDKPQGSLAALSSSIIPSPLFIPDVEGTYLIKLIVNNGAATDQQGAAVKTLNLKYRIPAATEEGEFDHTRGWAPAVNNVLKLIDDGYGNLLAAFGAGVPFGRLINTTPPLIGGGNLSADRTISIPQATSSVSGYLSSTDWLTFNSKLSSAFYQTVQANTTAQTQRNNLNFGPEFTIVDSNANNRTTVDLAMFGPGATTIGDAKTLYIGSITTDVYGRISAISTHAANWVNVKDYGAIGNGIVDDTASIQTAIDSIRDIGGVVFFPTGKYIISATIKLSQVGGHSYNNITLQGDGYSSWIKPSIALGPSGGGNGPVFFQGSSIYNLLNCGIKNLRISGFDETTNAQGPVVSWVGTTGSFAIDCYVDTNRNEGLYWGTPNADQDIYIRNVYITRVGGWGSNDSSDWRAAFNTNGNNVWLIDSHSYQCGMGVEQTGANFVCVNNLIEYCGLKGNTASPQYETGLFLESTWSSGKSIVDNNIIRFAATAISWQSTTTGECTANNNLIEFCDSGLQLYTTSAPITAKNNYLFDTTPTGNSQGPAILAGAGIVIVENNIIVGGAVQWAYGIHVLSAATAYVANNRLSGYIATTGALYADTNTAEFIDNEFLNISTIPTNRPLYFWNSISYNRLSFGDGILRNMRLSTIQPSILYLTTSPTSGTWRVGDVTINTVPSSTGISEWICTTAGTPGTWTQEFVVYTVQNAGTSLTQRSIFNASTGLIATDNSGSTRTDLTVDQNFSPTWTGTHIFNNAITVASISFPDGSSAGLSAANRGVIRYNNTSKFFEVSENGGSYSQLIQAPVDVSEQQLTDTASHNIINYSAVAGNYLLSGYYRVVTTSTIVTLTLVYTSVSGSQTINIVPILSMTVGDYSIEPITLNSATGLITLSAKSGTANQLYVSATLEAI